MCHLYTITNICDIVKCFLGVLIFFLRKKLLLTDKSYKSYKSYIRQLRLMCIKKTPESFSIPALGELTVKITFC